MNYVEVLDKDISGALAIAPVPIALGHVALVACSAYRLGLDEWFGCCVLSYAVVLLSAP